MATVRKKYRALVELAPDPIFLLNISDGTIIEVNESAASLLDYDQETLAGMDVTKIHPSDQREAYRTLFERAVASGEIHTAVLDDGTQMVLVARDGSRIPVEIHARTIEVDEEILLVGIARDITERNETNSELSRQNERLEEFTSVVSHDLRNPLNVAQLHLESARRERDSEDLKHVTDALERMETLIEDLLAVAKQGAAIEETQAVDISQLADQCWETVETDQATLSTDADYEIRANPIRLKQLFENLIRNAVEHSTREISIRVDTLDDETGFYIADDGPGVDEEDKEKIFDAGYTKTGEGTGFGLNIVEQVVKAHGCEITITDSIDGGARFEITGVENVS